jgi:hypothetical protein
MGAWLIVTAHRLGQKAETTPTQPTTLTLV